MHYRLTLVSALCCAMAAPARGQTPPLPPESVATQFVGTMRALDWTGMARLMHPSALHQLRELLTVLIQAPSADDLRQQLLGVRSVAAAESLSDTAVFAGLMHATLERDQGLADVMKSARMQVLGHINEGPDTVHVLYRMTLVVDSTPITRMDVASFARSPIGWRGLLKGDVTALAARLRRMLPRAN